MEKILCGLGIHRVSKWMFALVDHEAYGFCERCRKCCYRPLTSQERKEQADGWIEYPKLIKQMLDRHRRFERHMNEMLARLTPDTSDSSDKPLP